MAWVAKVNRHVAVLTTINGKLRRRPAVITALGIGELISARVGHTGEVYTNIDRRVNPDEDWTVNKYVSY